MKKNNTQVLSKKIKDGSPKKETQHSFSLAPRARLLMFGLTIQILILGYWIGFAKPMLPFGYYFIVHLYLLIAVLLAAIIVFVFKRSDLQQINVRPEPLRENLVYSAGSFVAIPFFMILSSLLADLKKFTTEHPMPFNSLPPAEFFETHTLLLSIPILLAVGLFGWKYLKEFFHLNKRVIIRSLGTILLVESVLVGILRVLGLRVL